MRRHDILLKLITMVKKTIKQKALEIHKKLGGKIEVTPKAKINSAKDLSIIYTPGVAFVSEFVKGNEKRARIYTIKGNSVAIVSDGSSVLGLGNIGALGALPVMEGKAVLFKEFAGIDAYPIVLDTQSVDEIVDTVKNIAPGFGGIILEDISAPRCFEIEERLKKELNIPVMHDDQHGTAIVVLAELINASIVVKKSLKKLSIVIIGAGAAGTAVTNLLVRVGIRDIVVVDSRGIIYKGRKNLNKYKKLIASKTNKKNKKGDSSVAIEGADVLIGVSGPKTITKAHVRSMARDAIVFALANPVPEIYPHLAKDAGAKIVATGRSDFPNQVNNALVFPGIFRGALDRGAKKITENMKIKAAHSLASIVKKPSKNKIIPSIFDKRVCPAIAKSVR